MKKIAIISSTFPPFLSGGISSAHYNLYETLHNRGVTVRVFTFAENGKFADTEEVVRRGTPPFILKVIYVVTLIYEYFMRMWDAAEFAHQFPNVLRTAIGAMRLNGPLRKFKPDLIVLPDNGAPGFFIRPPQGSKIAFVSHHNFMRFVDEPLFGAYSKRDAGLAMGFERHLLRKVDVVVCPSAYMKEVFVKTHAFRGPVHVIPNIVDEDVIAAVPCADIRGKIGLAQNAPLIYIPSPGHRLKGASFVFEIIRRLAASTCQDVGFFLSGYIHDPLLKRELDFLPENAKIYAPGNLDYRQNIAAIKSCSFAISPTLCESFGMAILEANFCEVPVVAFNVGGNADIIRDGENGFLVPYMAVEMLILHSQRLLENQDLSELRQQTLNSVRSRFGKDQIAHEFIEKLC